MPAAAPAGRNAAVVLPVKLTLMGCAVACAAAAARVSIVDPVVKRKDGLDLENRGILGGGSHGVVGARRKRLNDAALAGGYGRLGSVVGCDVNHHHRARSVERGGIEWSAEALADDRVGREAVECV